MNNVFGRNTLIFAWRAEFCTAMTNETPFTGEGKAESA
jgi:hypothetical protein